MAYATTLARVKAHLGDTGSANDTILTSLIAAVSADIESHLGYPLTQAARTELYDVALGDRYVFLRVVPVVSVASVKYGASDWDFVSVTALEAGRDYKLGADGQLILNFYPGGGPLQVEVVYTAGLGTTDEGVATAAPEVALAANIQIAEEWRRRRDPSTISVPTPKGNKTMDAPHRLLPRVRELLDSRVRMTLGVA